MNYSNIIASSNEFGLHSIWMTEKTGVDGGSMRTVDSKAQKSMPLVEEGSVKAKAEKVTGGGSMRLVDSSMKSKTGK